jgi:hypothetical protein
MSVVGVDLAGVETKPSGFCVLNTKSMEVKTFLLYRDDEIVREVLRNKPGVVAIDAPLALPKGRCCLRDDCACRGRGHFRKADLDMREMGIKFFPVTLGPMRKLTLRGIKLKRILEGKGMRVIEVFPGGAQDLLRVPRKQKGVEELRKGLMKLGLKGDISKADITDDELDSITSALVGKLYLEGNYVALGDPSEVLIIMPRREASLPDT